MLHGDARELDLPGPFDAVVTSPPYPGLIDYHEQHRYAYELLGLDDLREREIGAAASGTSKAALAAYVDGIAGVLAACAGVAEAAWADRDRRQRPARRSIRRSSSAPVSRSSSATSGTSTGAPAAAPVSTSSRCSSRAARDA